MEQPPAAGQSQGTACLALSQAPSASDTMWCECILERCKEHQMLSPVEQTIRQGMTMLGLI